MTNQSNASSDLVPKTLRLPHPCDVDHNPPETVVYLHWYSENKPKNWYITGYDKNEDIAYGLAVNNQKGSFLYLGIKDVIHPAFQDIWPNVKRDLDWEPQLLKDVIHNYGIQLEQ